MYQLKNEPRLDPPRRPPMPECPVCGNECEIFFLDINRSVIACDGCFKPRSDFDNIVNAMDYGMIDWSLI